MPYISLFIFSSYYLDMRELGAVSAVLFCCRENAHADTQAYLTFSSSLFTTWWDGKKLEPPATKSGCPFSLTYSPHANMVQVTRALSTYFACLKVPIRYPRKNH
ncbi:hypothetical protein CIPAW_02G155500 [Carya illinoinensis]|uniref:Uncharacterized protein n=1 Tax=Carya illinoinensis TaxID=32201 RepID=A0A8T1RES5_CARIL|nr:hypothetical protein CIPAW_02G155500 [Carya illinoinensis]